LEYENQKLIKYIDTQIDGLFQSKMRIVETGDILRETQVSQFYRYAKISQLLEAGQFCRYVGDITLLETRIAFTNKWVAIFLLI
jgi:hypothetical protein